MLKTQVICSSNSFHLKKETKFIVKKDFKDFVNKGYKILDIRSPRKIKQSKIVENNVVEVPLFYEPKITNFPTLFNSVVSFLLIGIMYDERYVVMNRDFRKQVLESVKNIEDTSLLIVCEKSLRSIMAFNELHEDNFKDIVILRDGTQVLNEDDVKVEGIPLEESANGGLKSKKSKQILTNVTKVTSTLLVLDILTFILRIAYFKLK